MPQQEQSAAALRAQIAYDPGDPNLHLQLATTLHGLDQRHPNGGRRIPEAEKAYRYFLGCWLSCQIKLHQVGA